jgi:hypothetical protein
MLNHTPLFIASLLLCQRAHPTVTDDRGKVCPLLYVYFLFSRIRVVVQYFALNKKTTSSSRTSQLDLLLSSTTQSLHSNRNRNRNRKQQNKERLFIYIMGWFGKKEKTLAECETIAQTLSDATKLPKECEKYDSVVEGLKKKEQGVAYQGAMSRRATKNAQLIRRMTKTR